MVIDLAGYLAGLTIGVERGRRSLQVTIQIADTGQGDRFDAAMSAPASMIQRVFKRLTGALVIALEVVEYAQVVEQIGLPADILRLSPVFECSGVMRQGGVVTAGRGVNNPQFHQNNCDILYLTECIVGPQRLL